MPAHNMGKRELLRRALESAIAWENSFLDAMKDCHTPEDEAARAYSKVLIAGWRDMLKKG